MSSPFVTQQSHCLSTVLSPVSTDEFIHSYFGKNFFRSVGQPGRFAGLLPWRNLNQLLRYHRLDSPRLRLVREGKSVAPESYVTYASTRRQPYTRIPRIRSADATRQLRDGATLVVDAVDEMCEPVNVLAQDLEWALRCRIQVNMYAGWRTSHGFDLHWDDHDVLILQVSGRKHWKVYSMTRQHPLQQDNRKKFSPPEQPLWEGMLDDGDVLYIPRGWWHVAVPLDEPTLHLTVGLHRKNGTDLLAWFAERLQESVAVRQDVPALENAEQKSSWADDIRQAFTQAWHPGIVDEYVASIDSRAQARPRFSLPWTATADILPTPGQEFRLAWLPPRPVRLVAAGDTFWIASTLR